MTLSKNIQQRNPKYICICDTFTYVRCCYNVPTWLGRTTFPRIHFLVHFCLEEATRRILRRSGNQHTFVAQMYIAVDQLIHLVDLKQQLGLKIAFSFSIIQEPLSPLDQVYLFISVTKKVSNIGRIPLSPRSVNGSKTRLWPQWTSSSCQ